MAKRYYWLRLKDDFFTTREMKKLRRIAGGDTYTIIYLKLQLLSLQDEGKLFFDGLEDTLAEELALVIDEDADNVRTTLMFLEKCGLLSQVSDREVLLTAVPTLIGSETDWAERKRIQRDKNKTLSLESGTEVGQCPKNLGQSHREKEIEKDIDIEIDTDIEKDINTSKPHKAARHKRNDTLTQKQLEAFERFYKPYPRKKQRGDAEKAWVVLKFTDEEVDAIVAAVDRQVAAGELRNDQYTPYPATWLRRKSWLDVEDDKPTPSQPTTPTLGANVTGQTVAARREAMIKQLQAASDQAMEDLLAKVRGG